MRALAGQRRVKEATRKQYKVVSRFIEATYMAIDWQGAKTRFSADFPEVDRFDIYVFVNRGISGHYRYMKSCGL